MKAPGTDKSRVVRLPKKLRFVAHLRFFFFVSLPLSLFDSFQSDTRSNTRHDDPCCGTNRRIGQLLRKEVGYMVTRSLVYNELIKRPR